jgi:hypothetical protein
MSLIPGKENPTQKEVEEYVKNASLDELASKVSKLNPNHDDLLHPADKFFIEEYNKRKQTGGRRRSKKRPTARRRSSKARKSRKSRKSRATRRR